MFFFKELKYLLFFLFTLITQREMCAGFSIFRLVLAQSGKQEENAESLERDLFLLTLFIFLFFCCSLFQAADAVIFLNIYCMCGTIKTDLLMPNSEKREFSYLKLNILIMTKWPVTTKEMKQNRKDIYIYIFGRLFFLSNNVS